MRSRLPLLAGLVVVVLWASAFPAIRVAAPALGPVGLSLVRLAVAAVCLLVAAAVTRTRLPRGRDLGWVAACGLLGMTAYQLLLNTGELHVPAGTASIIVAAAPLVSVAVDAAVFHARVSRLAIAGSLLALGGVAIVCLARAGLALSTAVWLVVAAMAVQGLYHPLQQPLLARYSSLSVAASCMLAGTLMTLPFLPLGTGRIAHAGVGAWVAAAYLGVMPSAVGFVLWAYAVARMPISASTALLYLVPPVAVLLAWAWLHELPVTAEIVGGLVVIAGVVTVSLGERLDDGGRQAVRAGDARSAGRPAGARGS